MRKINLRETKGYLRNELHILHFACWGGCLKFLFPSSKPFSLGAQSLFGLGQSPKLRLTAQDSLPSPAGQPPRKETLPVPLATERAAIPLIGKASSQRVQMAHRSAPPFRQRCLHGLNMTHHSDDSEAQTDLTAWQTGSADFPACFRHPNKLTHVPWWYKIVFLCVSVCFRASVQAHDCQLNIYQTPADLREGSIIHWLSEHQYQLFLKGSFSSWSVEPI